MTQKHISFSEYRLYKTCPFKHYLSKDLKYSEPSNEFLMFGSAVHATIEEIIKKQPSKILWKPIFEKHLLNESNEVLMKTYFGRLFTKQGVEIIKELNFFERFKEWEVVGVEDELYEELFNHEGDTIYFKGIIDLVLKKGDEYLILDWKTGAKPWDIEKKKQDRDFFGQLALYKHFYAKKHNIPIEKIQTRFVNLTRDPVSVQQFDIDLSSEFCEYILNDIISIAKQIITTTERLKLKHYENKTACSGCYFHNKICNDDPFQKVEPYKSNKS
jgi:hypothetical protein